MIAACLALLIVLVVLMLLNILLLTVLFVRLDPKLVPVSVSENRGEVSDV